MSAQPLSLADSTLWGTSGLKASASPSISSDGQLVAFSSDADDLVPNDHNNITDTFVYNRATGAVSLVSVGVNGVAAGSGSSPAISPDGRYVVFDSGSNYLQQPILPGISGSQLYLRDLQTGTTSLLSAAGSVGGNGTSFDPVWSADSRHVAFLSNAKNLVGGISIAGNGGNDLYERDLNTGTTRLVSVSLDGAHNGNADTGSSTRAFGLSADGRYVAFRSSASNLVAIGNSGIEQVYVRDVVAGVTTMVSVEQSGLAGAPSHNNVDAGSQIISADGRYVAFNSGASNLVSVPVSGTNSYLRDLWTGTTTLVSASAVTGQGVGSNGSEILSPDGRWTAFATSAVVTATPTNGKTNVYVRNNLTGATTLVSVNAAGTAGGNDSSGVGTFYNLPGNLSFSADGHYLAFRSLATDLTSGVSTSHRNLYARDLIGNTTILLTPNAAGTDCGDGDSDTAVFSADGRYVAFESTSNDLVAGDMRRVGSGTVDQDIFVRDLSAAHPALVSVRSPLLPPWYSAAAGATLGSVSADGRYVAFTSNVFYGQSFSDLAPAVTTSSTFSTSHVFVRDRQTGAIEVIDLDSNGVAVGGSSPVISADGRYVAFVGYTNLLPSGVATSDVHDLNVYVRDRQTGTTSLVSVTTDGSHDVPVNGDSEIAISANGQYVAFTSNFASPIPGVTNPGRYKTIYFRDVQAGTTTLASHDLADDGQIRGISGDMTLSTDGRFIAFRSMDANLVANDGNNGYDVFRWDRTTGDVTLVSVNAAGTGPGNNTSADSERAVMTPDGRYVAFKSNASNLVAGDTNGVSDIFVRDMDTGTTTLVSLTNAGGLANNASSYPSISDDGSRVAFISYASNLTSNPTAGSGGRLFVRDRSAATTVAVSVNLSGAAVYGGGTITPDGRYVFFGSDRTDLVPDFVDGNGSGQDLYVRDLAQNLTKLVTTNLSGTASGNANTNASTFNYRIAANSTAVFFDGDVSDLFANDRNGQRDVFVAATAGYSTIRGRVFNDANNNGLKDGAEAGMPYWTVYLDTNQNGVWDPTEPSLLTDASGDYAFTGLAPGVYHVAVVTQPGWQETAPGGAGTFNVTIATDGSITAGRDFGEFLPVPDLKSSGVTVTPTSGAPGELVSVSWTVTNVGNATAPGAWQDAVYLSATPAIGADAQLLTTVGHTGGLGVNAKYTENVQVPLPPSLGTWYIVVQTDRRNQVSEGLYQANKVNNVAPSPATLAITIPHLSVGTPATAKLSTIGPDRYYKVTGTAGQSLLLTLESTAANGQIELYVKRGAVPTDYDFDFASRTPGQTSQSLTIPQVQPGTYYILVHAVAGDAKTSTYTLTASEPGLSVQSLGLTTAGNSGRVTIPIHGTNLTADTPIKLSLGATTLTPVAVDFHDPSLIYATFDLSGRPAGAYTLSVGGPSHTASLTVTAARGPDLKVNLSVPSAVRTNNPGAILVVDFENDGDTDMPAPIFTMESVGHPDGIRGFLRLLQGDTPVSPDRATIVQFVGQGQDSPGGVLRAGDKGQVKVKLTFDFVDAGGGPYVDVTLSTLPVDSTPIDWNGLKDQIKPDSVSDAAWNAIFNNFTASVGSTEGDFQSALVADTAYLNQIGVANPTFSQLVGFELMRADAALPIHALASTLDAAFPAPGLNLAFTRQFVASISGRDHLGTLGRGWVSNWDVSASTQADGSVLVEDQGAERTFVKQPDGSFLAGAGDHGVLNLTSGAYQLREPNGTLYRFRTDGTLDYVQDTNGNRITAGYNDAGQLVSLTHSDGDALAITYDANGRVRTITDPAGRVATYAYDATGEHLLSVATAQGTTRYSYITGVGGAREHALASVTDPSGTQIHFTYDVHGRLASSYFGTDADPIDRTTVSYVSPGGIAFTDAAGTTTVAFNQSGQPAVITDPLGRAARATYDASGNLVGVALPGGLSYSYGYDANGNLTRVTDPLGRETSFTYTGPLNTLSSFRDARGNTTQYQHDANGNLLSITYADGTQKSFTYDPLGNLTDTINARGQAVGYAHNASGQVTQATFADGSHTDYTYDAHGNLATATDSAGTTTLVYDAADRLTKVTYPDGMFLQFSYNAGGQRIQSADQTGYTVRYQYDSVGRLVGLTDTDGHHIVSYAYDDADRLIQKDLGNGTRTTYTYDAAGQLLHLVNLAPDHTTVNTRFDYTYDELGRVKTQDNSDGTWTYTYDAAGELTHAVFISKQPAVLPGQDLACAYDAAGNRVSTTINGVTTDYTVNGMNEYTQVGATKYTYDADGNLQTETVGGVTTTYTFDELNRLVSVASPSGTTSQTFDALGQRDATTQNGQTTTYLNDPTGSGNVTGLGTLVGAFNGTSALAHYAWGLGLTSRTDAAGTAYFDFDALGSTAGLTNASGVYVNRYSYLPFGETTTLGASLANSFTYVGQFGVTAGVSGSLMMGLRAYDAQTGQFLSPDPLGLAGGSANLRSYVANAPVALSDSAGLAPTPLSWENYNMVMGEAMGRWVDHFQITEPGEDATAGYIEGAQFEKGFDTAFHEPAFNQQEFTFTDGPFMGRTFTGHELNYATVGWYAVDGHLPIDAAYLGANLYTLFNHGRLATARENASVAIGYFTYTAIRDRVLLERRLALEGNVDPNEMFGPSGSGTQNWVGPDQNLAYAIAFENDPKLATVAVQDVVVTQTLDADLDWSTFQLGDIQFGATTISVPAGLRSFSTSVLTTNIDGTPLRVDVSARLDLDSGVVTWEFHSLDPVTGQVPLDVYSGFLPPDDATHRGQGQVSYTVRPKAGLANGTEIRAVADIVFDTNASIATNQVDPHDASKGTDPAKEGLATIDSQGPTSAVTALPTYEGAKSFTVSWSGTDGNAGSGVATYDVYVSDNGGAFQPFQSGTTATSATFTGTSGHKYAFRSVATDAVGNREASSGTAQATTRVDADPPTSTVSALPASIKTPSFTVAWAGDDGAGSGVASYDVYVSDNNRPFTPFQSGTTATSATFTGSPGHTYRFYSVATDDLGHVQPTPAAAQAVTHVQGTPTGDFDGDGITDPAVYEPSTSTFYIANSQAGNQAIQFGIGTKYGGRPVNVTASYEGNGLTDPAVFEPSTSTFYIHTSHGNIAVQFGIGTRYGGNPIPVPGDYEGDGIIDPAVFEPSTATFYIARHNAPNVAIQFGIGTRYGGHPVPVPGNYEGDGTIDPAVFEPSTSTFYIARHNAPNVAIQFGIGTRYGGNPTPVPGNYEGDGQTDPAVFEPSTSTFYIARHNAPNAAIQFGIGTRYGGHPVVASADYEGDGRTDPAVFEPSTSTFYIARHNAPNVAVQFGIGTRSGGNPVVVSADYEGDGQIDPAVFEPSTSTFYIARHGRPNTAVQFGIGTRYGGHPQPISSRITPASQGGLSAPSFGVVVSDRVTVASPNDVSQGAAPVGPSSVGQINTSTGSVVSKTNPASFLGRASLPRRLRSRVLQSAEVFARDALAGRTHAASLAKPGGRRRRPLGA